MRDKWGGGFGFSFFLSLWVGGWVGVDEDFYIRLDSKSYASMPSGVL